MSLGTKLVQSAQKEAALQRPFPLHAEANEPLSKGGEVRAVAKIADNDRFTKLTSEVTVSVQGASSLGRISSVEAKAERFAAKTTYLIEALTFVETNLGGTAIVRSTPETMAGRGAPYFEALVTNDEVTLRRYQAQNGGGRKSEPFALTDEVLGRLVEDAVSVLALPKK